jgi:hypothetical protein
MENVDAQGKTSPKDREWSPVRTLPAQTLIERWATSARDRLSAVSKRLSTAQEGYISPETTLGRIFDRKGRRIERLNQEQSYWENQLRPYEKALSALRDGSTEEASRVIANNISGQIISMELYSHGEDQSLGTVAGSHRRAEEYLVVLREIDPQTAQELTRECNATWKRVGSRIPLPFQRAF